MYELKINIHRTNEFDTAFLKRALTFESSPCVDLCSCEISTETLCMDIPNDFSSSTTERWITVALDSASCLSSLMLDVVQTSCRVFSQEDGLWLFLNPDQIYRFLRFGPESRG